MQWIKASELPIKEKSLPDVVITQVDNKVFAYDTKQNLNGLKEIIKHHPEMMVMCLNKYSPDSPSPASGGLREALTELVELKRIKDTEGETPEYLSRKWNAWEAARKALSSPVTDDLNELMPETKISIKWMVRSQELADALRAYIKASNKMLHNWSEGDEAVKKQLWKNLHSLEDPARELLQKTPSPVTDQPNKMANPMT